MREVSVSYIVSTMNRSDVSFIKEIFSNINLDEFQNEIIIVNQSTNNIIDDNNQNFKIINSAQTGISKSRNLGLSYVNNDIIHFLDDDVVLNQNCVKIYNYLFNSDCSIVTGKISDQNGNFHKKYKTQSFRHNIFSILKVSSMECIYKSNIFLKGIRFDKNFGIGSDKYLTGEENILLADCLKSKFKIIYKPKLFLCHDEIFRDKNKYLTINMMKSNGAVFSKIFGSYLSVVLCFFWLIKKCFDGDLNKNHFFISYGQIIKGIFFR